MNNLTYKSTTPWLIALCISLSGCSGEPPSPKKMLNPDHQFTFNGCDIRYNDEPLILGKSVDEWVEVLGPYDRMSPTASDVYVYDDMGIVLYAGHNTKVIKSLTLLFNEEKEIMQEIRNSLKGKKKQREQGDLDPNSIYFKGLDLSIEFDENVLSSKPKQTFKQGFAIDDVIFDEHINRYKLNTERLKRHPNAPRFAERYLPNLYDYSLDCDNSARLFTLRMLSTDLTKLHSFSVVF
ncbi:hypothetical protein [Alkalimarinus coralli]|uniref:DUF7738 domain-containing protein n=1 Tax=Alkalimarinus coralli TaxID=2935863 RepID=UPI00202AC7E9|nr:hypothetical protein [Alkalimarinus coralli]